MTCLLILGSNLKSARKTRYPKDNLATFSIRIGVSRATLQKMEKGDLKVSIESYYEAAKILGVENIFNNLFEIEDSLFDD